MGPELFGDGNYPKLGRGLFDLGKACPGALLLVVVMRVNPLWGFHEKAYRILRSVMKLRIYESSTQKKIIRWLSGHRIRQYSRRKAGSAHADVGLGFLGGW